MSNKTYQTTLLIRGDSKDAVRSVQLTKDELEKLTGAQRTGINVTEQYREKFNQGAMAAAKWGAAIGAAAVAAGAAMVRSGLQSVDSLAKTSDKLGVTTEALAQLRFAAEQTGVSSGTLDMALQRMTRRVAEAAQGSGEAVNALKELGISAEDLVKKSPDQMFRQITSSMGNVENQADKVRLAMKLFDSEGVSLVNTMKDGVGALDQFAKEADAAGLSISRIDAAKVEAANDAMARVRATMTGVTQQMAIKFAPVLESIADKLFKVGTEGGGASELVGKAFSNMVKAAGFFGDALRGLQVGWYGMKLVFQEVYRFIFEKFNWLGTQLTAIWNKLPFVDEVQYTDAIEGFLLTMDSEIAESRRKIDELMSKPLPSDAIDAFVADANKAFAEALAEAESSANGTANAYGVALEEVTVSAKVAAGQIQSEITETTAVAAKEADAMAVAWARGIERMRDGLGDFFERMIVDGKASFSDLANLFKKMIAEMIATAAANRIFIGLGLGGVSGAASAAGGVSGLSGLGSLLSIGTGGSLISGIAGLGSALGLGAQTGAFLGSTGQLGYNALSALGIQGAGGTTSFLAGGALTAGAGILGGLAGNALGSSLTGRTSNSNWGAGLGGTAGAFLGGPLGAAIGGAIGGALDSAFGSSKNRIGGVGINTGTREANLWGTKRPEYQDPMQELANVLQGFSDAIGGSGSIMTISRGNKSPLQMDGVEFASVSDLIAAAMDNILDTAWELAPVVKDLAKAFDGSVEETAAFARAMQGLWEQTKINPVSQAVDDFAAAQRTAYDGYRAQMDAIRQMAMEFDGSVASAQTLTQALANNQAAAYQLAQQYLQVGAQIRGSASSSAQSIRESVMTDEERTAALKGRRSTLRDSLGTLTDPGQIASTFAEVVRLNEQIFQGLSPAAQQGQAEAYAKYIERTAEIQENRLEKLRAETEREQRQQNAEVRNALQESAAAQQEAANTMLSAAQAIQAAATALSGGFGGFTGQEVVQ